MVAGDIQGPGYGEANSKLLAVQKSIAEGVERIIFKALRETPGGTLTSNGWAAHIDDGCESAISELIERDAVLTHWLCKKPMTEVES